MSPDPLEAREVFHLAFLRAFVRTLRRPASFVLKGGCNLRFFFGSIRYSEDMDLDVGRIAVHELRDKVMSILTSSVLADTLRTYRIERVVPPTLARAKQTETVQRFKVHLLTAGGVDLHTKIEFSRRGFDTPIQVESVSAAMLGAYRMPPLIVPHYAAEAAVRQKLLALARRQAVAARDIFDLFVLSSRPDVAGAAVGAGLSPKDLGAARERIFAVSHEQYRDTVVAFLGQDDRTSYESSEVWDEIRLRANLLLERATGR